MAKETTYSHLRENLAAIMDQVLDDLEVVIVHRRGKRGAVALIDAQELASLQETDYLLRSPNNARALAKSMREAKAGKAREFTMDALRREVGIERAR
ncbi:MAG: type II toxin-antitoxin system prevent-host-death family antitoxin [Bryobacter sp.]|jgi:antitoxin YefM|nr:type II toxin-antitoxin system prevent-host-death family antitoxin [Bryobacter sp.]